ncbi:hypothetical protein QP888_03530 [Corynebacterium sp. MSK297]|uniref:hypothetical protein n=1 Tax=Corynebacterium sp. MSK297 TaxID=3050221 RepID=UPI002551B436|nr:hypothetical protein [Corynebacterium sp. MSK297]MDK8845595.1 hypothetical protein [Corynebacterium sp. MSK297]
MPSTLKLVAIGVVIAASVVQTVGTEGSGADSAPWAKVKKLHDIGTKGATKRTEKRLRAEARSRKKNLD